MDQTTTSPIVNTDTKLSLFRILIPFILTALFFLSLGVVIGKSMNIPTTKTPNNPIIYDERPFKNGISASTEPAQVTQIECERAGCSGQLCIEVDPDRPRFSTTCEYRDEYACYKLTTCEKQADGNCGWTQTPELQECLNKTQEKE